MTQNYQPQLLFQKYDVRGIVQRVAIVHRDRNMMKKNNLFVIFSFIHVVCHVCLAYKIIDCKIVQKILDLVAFCIHAKFCFNFGSYFFILFVEVVMHTKYK